MEKGSKEDTQLIRVVRAPDAPPIESIISRRFVARDGAVALVQAGVVNGDASGTRVVYTEEGVGGSDEVAKPAVIALSVPSGSVDKIVGALRRYDLVLEATAPVDPATA